MGGVTRLNQQILVQKDKRSIGEIDPMLLLVAKTSQTISTG